MSSAILNIPLFNGQVDHFHREWKEGTLVLNPEFQRSNQVWDKTRKSLLIESLIVGFPIPPVFLSETEGDGKTREVVDGLQRLTAIFGFLDGEFTLRDLEFTAMLNGQKFEDLSEGLKQRVQRGTLSFYVLPSDSKHWRGRLKHIVFNRLNQGVPVNVIERIMGTHPGPGNELVVESSGLFIDMWKEKPTRVAALQRRGKHHLYSLVGLAAVQLVLGDEALMLGDWEYKRGGKNPWEQLLVQTLGHLNGLDDQSRTDLGDQLKEALDTVVQVFDNPFQTWNAEQGNYRSSVKDAALVCQLWGFARPSKVTTNQWVAKKDEIESAWRKHTETQTITHQANTLFASLKAWGETLDKISV